MTKKKPISESNSEQSARFIKDAQRMIDAGELSLIEGDKGLDRLVTNRIKKTYSNPT
jgi:hypothetical protein